MRRKPLMLFPVAGLILAFMAATVSASVIGIPDPNDPAVMHIGNPPNAKTYLFDGEVLPVSSTFLQILQNGGSDTLVDPALLLILGVPNRTDLNFTAPTITLSAGTGTVGGANLFSGAWDVTTGYAGSFTAASTANDVYQFIGLDPFGNASNNFTNWADWELAVNGFTADSFGIFVYRLTGTGMAPGVQIDVTFDDPLLLGTYALAYGQSPVPDRGPVQSYTTPFTETGMVQPPPPIPEPATILLLGSGLVGLGGWSRRKFRR